jgi:hypothetical protein
MSKIDQNYKNKIITKTKKHEKEKRKNRIEKSKN